MIYVFFAAAATLTFCVVYLMLCNAWKEKLTVAEQLDKLQGTKPQDKKARFSFIRVSEAFQSSIDLSGIKMGPDEFVMMWIVVTFFPALLVLVVSVNPIAAIFTAFLAAFAPIIYLRAQISRQKMLFERQLGDALMVLSNALRAGISFPQALASAANNLSQPISREFMAINRDLQLGVDIEEAMLKVVDRMESADLRVVTTAVVIQRQTGGNLSEILDTVAQTVRDRAAIKRSVKTLTAQGRISGKIIGALPIALAFIISVINPAYIMPLFTTSIGRILLIVGAVMEVCGFLVINKIVDIKF